MAQLSGIEKGHAERRRALLQRSEELRGEIAADIANLRPVVQWVERGYSVALSIYSFWPILGGLTGFALARKKGSLLSKVAKAWSFFKLGKKAVGIFQQMKSQPARQETE